VIHHNFCVTHPFADCVWCFWFFPNCLPDRIDATSLKLYDPDQRRFVLCFGMRASDNSKVVTLAAKMVT
jgi:hypothetical protein